MKERSKIPTKIADELIFRSDMVCAVCQAPGHHIHHLDNNPSNNEPDNLIYLCFSHHDAATAKGKLSRKLSKGVLVQYRDLHYQRVEAKRRLQFSSNVPKKTRMPDEQAIFQLAMDAVVCVEVERVKSNLHGWNWPVIMKHIYELNHFPLGIGFRARISTLYALEDVSSRTRHRMPLEVAQAVQHVAANILPYRTVHSKVHTRIRKDAKEILQIGVSIGFNLAYDAIRYLGNIKIVDQGAQILWQVLCFAHASKVSDIEKYVVSEFGRAKETALMKKDRFSAELLDLYRNQGLSGDLHFPDYPEELVEKLT